MEGTGALFLPATKEAVVALAVLAQVWTDKEKEEDEEKEDSLKIEEEVNLLHDGYPPLGLSLLEVLSREETCLHEEETEREGLT